MPLDDKIMFEIYRDKGEGAHRVVYYTELGEHERNVEIERAMRGETVFNGFLRSIEAPAAKPAIAALLTELDAGKTRGGDLPARLSPFLAE